MESVKLTIDDKVEVFEGETKQEARKKMHERLQGLRAEFKKRHENDKERPAEGVRGFLLYNPFTKQHFFRIYDWQDDELCNKQETTNLFKFRDYKVCAEDIEVQILAGGLALYDNEEGDNRLDWSSRVLGRPEKK